MDQTKLIANLQKVMEEGYKQACHYFRAMPYRQVVFKGFFSPEIQQEILDNQEILTNLKITTLTLKKYFAEEIQNLTFTKAGIALPAKWETWIILNPFFIKFAEEKWIPDLVETVAHELAHAVIFNWDTHWGHADPHAKITKYLQDYLQKNYDWSKIYIGTKN